MRKYTRLSPATCREPGDEARGSEEASQRRMAHSNLWGQTDIVVSVVMEMLYHYGGEPGMKDENGITLERLVIFW